MYAKIIFQTISVRTNCGESFEGRGQGVDQ